MGNTPSKQGMANPKRKRGSASSRKQDFSPPPVENKKSKTKTGDDDVVILDSKKGSSRSKDKSSKQTASATVTSGPASSSLPKPGPIKIKPLSSASVGRPKLDKSPSSSTSSSRRSKSEPLPPLISTKTGPRAEVNEKEYYKVQGVVKKWVGKSDQSVNDEFYLIHWAGRPPPRSAGDNESWLHRSQLMDCEAMIAKADAEFEIAKEERKKKSQEKRKPFFEIVSEDEDEEKKKPVVEVTGIEAAGKVLRQRDSNLNFNEDGKDVKHSTPRRSAVVKKEPVGFDRGLNFEKIIAVANYNGRLAYLLKFEGSTKCDLVPASVCRKKIPDQVIEFLKKNSSGFEKIEESSLAPDALKLIKRADKVEERM